MRRLALILALCLCWFGCQRVQSEPPRQPALPKQIEAHFSPHGGCTDAIVKELDAAKKMILVQAYSFTSAPIAKALVKAHKRGVDVRVILDKGQRTAKYSSADFLRNMGIPTLIDAKHAIAHNKVYDYRRAGCDYRQFQFLESGGRAQRGKPPGHS